MRRGHRARGRYRPTAEPTRRAPVSVPSRYRWQKLHGLASGVRSETREVRAASHRSWLPIKPIGHTLDIDCRGGGHVLQMGLRQAAVACRPQSERSYPLRERAFDPRTAGVVSGKAVSLLALAGRLNRLMFSPRLQRQTARQGLGTGALSAHWTGGAVRCRKRDANHPRSLDQRA